MPDIADGSAWINEAAWRCLGGVDNAGVPGVAIGIHTIPRTDQEIDLIVIRHEKSNAVLERLESKSSLLCCLRTASRRRRDNPGGSARHRDRNRLDSRLTVLGHGQAEDQHVAVSGGWGGAWGFRGPRHRPP